MGPLVGKFLALHGCTDAGTALPAPGEGTLSAVGVLVAVGTLVAEEPLVAVGAAVLGLP